MGPILGLITVENCHWHCHQNHIKWGRISSPKDGNTINQRNGRRNVKQAKTIYSQLERRRKGREYETQGKRNAYIGEGSRERERNQYQLRIYYMVSLGLSILHFISTPQWRQLYYLQRITISRIVVFKNLFFLFYSFLHLAYFLYFSMC